MALTFSAARQLILDHVTPGGTEIVFLPDAAGRVLAKEIAAPWDMPQWDNSAMDGYAVRAGDYQEAATLRIVGYLPAGGEEQALLTPGCAIKIMTGAPIPPEADAVVPFETATEANGTVTLHAAVKAGDHIRFRGEDVKAGESVLPAGTALRPPEINLLASFGQACVPVYRRPRVAILSTGDELVELGEPLARGRIVNSNALSLSAAVREAGAEAILLGIARDNVESLREKLTTGLQADALITSAGVSAGDRDLVREVLEELGVRQLFWKIDIKPGRPTAFGIREGKPVFSLPGNPVSSMITFEELVRPALRRMLGHTRVLRPALQAVLREPAKKKAGRLHFLRVQVTYENGQLFASSAGDQNTGILRTMVRANGIALLPADREHFAAGDTVELHLLGEW
jgi:molybdopterin molybdotransferase